MMAITGMNIDKFRKFGWRFFDLLKVFVKEHRENMEGVDMSQLQSQYNSQAPIDVPGQDDDEENYIDSEDDEDYAQTGERSEYFASGNANFQPPGMSQAQRALMEQVASATGSGSGGSSSKATSGARVKKAYSAGPRRGAKRAGGASGSSTRRKSSGGKRFSGGSAEGAAGRGGRSAGSGRGARGGRGSASIIRPMS